MAKPALALAAPAPGKPTPGAGGKANNGKDTKNGHSKKKKKRMRGGQKFRILHLQKPGEEPLDKRLKGGRVRKMNVLGSRAKDDALPRKTRDMLARITRMNGDTSNVNAVSQQHWNKREEDRRHKGGPPRRGPEHTRRAGDAVDITEKKMDHVDVPGATTPPVGPGATSQATPSARFEGMKPGESFVQFNQRINQERRKAALDAARKLNHQRQKKKAHYEKRAQRDLRRKRRRRGELSEDEDEDDDAGESGDDDYGNKTGNSKNRQREYRANTVDDNDDGSDVDSGLGALPTYWQDIVRNNGRPISEKKRKRMERIEKARDARLAQRRQDGPWEQQRQEKVRFGEQVDRPPTLTVMPRKRGGSGVKHDKNNRK